MEQCGGGRLPGRSKLGGLHWLNRWQPMGPPHCPHVKSACRDCTPYLPTDTPPFSCTCLPPPAPASLPKAAHLTQRSKGARSIGLLCWLPHLCAFVRHSLQDEGPAKDKRLADCPCLKQMQGGGIYVSRLCLTFALTRPLQQWLATHFLFQCFVL